MVAGDAIRSPEAGKYSAASFLYLQNTAFGGKVYGRNFGVDKSGGAHFNLTRLAPLLEDVSVRLTGVVIKCLP